MLVLCFLVVMENGSEDCGIILAFSYKVWLDASIIQKSDQVKKLPIQHFLQIKFLRTALKKLNSFRLKNSIFEPNEYPRSLPPKTK